MPALDIGQIRFEAAELASVFADPHAFVAGAREFFRRHSDPTVKQSPIVSVHVPLKGYGTPAPVMRTLVGALRKAVLARPALALALIERLWAEPVREMKRLAVELLGLLVTVCPGDVEALMMRWQATLDDLELIEVLATQVTGPWVLGDAGRRLALVRQWVNSPHKHQRQFGVMTLAPLAKQRNFADVSAALEVLNGAMYEGDPEVRKNLAHVLRDFAVHGPSEVTRFLSQWADTTDKNTNWIVRHAVEKLDADAQADILAVLRGRNRAG